MRSRMTAAVLAAMVLLTSVGLPAGARPDGTARQARAAVAALAAQKAAALPPPAAGPPAVPGQLLVTATTPTAAEDMRPALPGWASLPLARVQPLTGRVSLLHVPAGTEAEVTRLLAGRPGVAAVEPVRLRTFATVPDDPRYGDQWSHQVARTELAWDVTTGTHDVLVAVLDSGALGDHHDLAGNLVGQVDASTGEIRPVALGSNNDECAYGHGSLVSGIIGAQGDNGTDVTGVNWAVSLLDVALSSEDNGCGIPDSAILAGIAYALEQNADVINLSLGALQDACPTAYDSAVADARARGTLIIAASGNEELDPATAGRAQVPASCNGVISVGAVGRSGERAGYSTTNEFLDLLAPGGDSDVDADDGLIVSTSVNGGVEPTEGTSFSAPYVTGVVALLRAANPTITPDQIEATLEQTAVDLEEPGRDPTTGFGRLDAGAALAVAQNPPATPAPDPDFPVGDDPGGVTGFPPVVFRVDAENGTTEPITQAVAMSQLVFDDYDPAEPAGSTGALHAVLARADDFADALAGSALGFGFAPLLFTASTSPLSGPTRTELRRVLPPGADVYLLGGGEALPVTLEQELRDMGYNPLRLAGTTREETAVIVAAAVRELLPALGFSNPQVVILATRQNWPDAVSAGALASYFGFPVLLTPTTGLHPRTADALHNLQPDLLYVIGGRNAVDDATFLNAAAAAGTTGAGETVRLAGPARDATAVAIAREVELLLGDFIQATKPQFAIAVNLRRADGFAHVLSASPLAGRYTGVFAPVEGEAGTRLTDTVAVYLRNLGIDGVVVGDVDIVADTIEVQLEELLQPPPEPIPPSP